MFYDVTTLYFEAFESDELRKTGFSKDNKSQQPQILIGLMVSKEGFPVAYELFPGNTFEGHTLLPVIKSFINKHNVKDFTVVADAAMISSANVQELKKENIHYIVGARLGNVSTEIVRQIDQQLPREDGKMIRLNTSNGFLIFGYSQQRFKKDKFEMQKQIEKANHLIKNPAKNRRVKFIKTESNQMELNTSLIAKTTMLLGVKGYYSDLPENIADNKTIIKNYHDLYKVEQAFRISKHDLQSRPIFHFKEDPIRLHILICFMSLAISRYIELKTGASIRAFLTMSKKVTDARLFNKITQKAITLRSKMEDPLPLFLEKLRLPY